MKLSIIIITLLALIGSAAAQTITLAGVEASIPSAWIAVKPATTMRLAQFQIPAENGSDAELVVFYFGPNQGGSPAANIARWQSQFSAPDGGPVEPAVKTNHIDGMPVTEVELKGNYARGIGTGPVGTAKSNQTLQAAIVEGPQGKLFVQLYGPSDTVATQRQAFDNFIHSMRQKTP